MEAAASWHGLVQAGRGRGAASSDLWEGDKTLSLLFACFIISSSSANGKLIGNGTCQIVVFPLLDPSVYSLFLGVGSCLKYMN